MKPEPNLPAILLAGPPHCGKSVLGYQLTQSLSSVDMDHYLLRAVPDGEGNWFFVDNRVAVYRLRNQLKHDYTDKFIDHMSKAISDRMVPLLVDIGGQPRDHQWQIPNACTHSILLYQTEKELMEWRQYLANQGLIPLAELQSVQNQAETVSQAGPILQGTIGGLERSPALRRTGVTFAALQEKVADVIKADKNDLENLRRQAARGCYISEQALAQQIGICQPDQSILWHPEDLRQVIPLIPQEKIVSIDGRGPVWLAAALAVGALPGQTRFFDIRYGWVKVPEVEIQNPGNLRVERREYADYTWFEVSIPDGIYEEKNRVAIPPFERTKPGVVISGKLPRWVYAALAVYFSTRYEWVAVRNLPQKNLTIISSRSDLHRIGETLDDPEEKASTQA